MRVAIIHDWLNGLRGGERCLLAFLKLYPEADIFTLFHKPGTTAPVIDKRVVKVSWLNELPFAAKFYRYFLPLYPHAINSFDLTGYDLVISLSHAAAKNIIVPPGTVHISYVFTPMRYVWDQAEQYFGKLLPVAKPLIKYLANWDKDGARRLDGIIGISRFIAARIRCFYNKRAEVIYPPVEASWIKPLHSPKTGSFLIAGAQVPYKRIDLAIQAFNQLGLSLNVVGSGPESEKLRKMAAGNIRFYGKVSDSELAGFYASSRALIFPGIEDFGIMPIECLAAGRPVIGLYKGGLRETLVAPRPWLGESLEPGHCGVFIKPLSDNKKQVQEIINSVIWFIENENKFSTADCVKQASYFSTKVFERSWCNYLKKLGFKDFLPASYHVSSAANWV